MEVVSRRSSVVGERLIQEERLAYGAPRGYRDLDVYKRSFALLGPVHTLVKTFPDYEKWDLAQQMRRAAKSIPANIAEGYALRDAPRLSAVTSASLMAPRPRCASISTPRWSLDTSARISTPNMKRVTPLLPSNCTACGSIGDAS